MIDGNPVGAIEDDESLNARVLALSTRAESVLAAHPRTLGLAANLPHPDAGPLRIGLLGPYSAGKSMLVAALLRLPPNAVDELIDAAPKTNKPTEYEWSGAVLLDLPGTLSGNDRHSEVARLGVRLADALMIVTTSELPGEAETAAILQALDTDGFADRSVVVVNKMNAENSDPDVILDEIRKRIGPFANRVPIVPTDARDYVDAINDANLTDDQRELLLAESGVDALANELRRIIEPGVESVRPKAQAFELARVLADAEKRWVLEGEDLSAAETAKTAQNAISSARGSVLNTLETESEVVASVVRSAGNRIATSLSEKGGEVAEDVLRDADQRRAGAIANFEAKFASSMRLAFDALVADYRTGVPEPEAWLFDYDSPAMTISGCPDDESPRERKALEAVKGVARQGSEKLHGLIAKVAASGNENGSLASDIATRINESRLGQKLLGGDKVGAGAGKFKPYGRGKAADKVAGAAGKLQWAAVLIGPVLDLTGVVDDQVKRVKIDKHRKKIRNQFDEDALRTRNALADSATQCLSEWIGTVEDSLSGLTNQGSEIVAVRGIALGEIKVLRDEAEGLVRIALLPSTPRL